MPYYRIIIFLKGKKPIEGIRHYEINDIERVYRTSRSKAEDYYKGAFLDIEVQMLSKISTAVKKYLAAQQKKREDKNWPEPTPFTPIPKRKDQLSSKPNWGENI